MPVIDAQSSSITYAPILTATCSIKRVLPLPTGPKRRHDGQDWDQPWNHWKREFDAGVSQNGIIVEELKSSFRRRSRMDGGDDTSLPAMLHRLLPTRFYNDEMLFECLLLKRELHHEEDIGF